jgi:hypothetical protein
VCARAVNSAQARARAPAGPTGYVGANMMNRLVRLGLGAICACVLGGTPVAGAAGPVTVTVTPLPPATGFSDALGIGNSGVVLGRMRPSNPGPPPTPGYWADGVFHALPGLPGASPGFNTGTFGVNDAGVIVGFAAFRLTGINDAGQISGYATTSDFHTQIPFIVSVPEPAALPVLALGDLLMRRRRRPGART